MAENQEKRGKCRNRKRALYGSANHELDMIQPSRDVAEEIEERVRSVSKQEKQLEISQSAERFQIQQRKPGSYDKTAEKRDVKAD